LGGYLTLKNLFRGSEGLKSQNKSKKKFAAAFYKKGVLKLN